MKMQAANEMTTIYKPRNAKIASKRPKLGRSKEGFSSRGFREHTALPKPYSKHLDSKSKREKISIVLSHQVCVNLLQQP